MEWLVIIGLLVAVVMLWNRIGELGRRVRELELAEPQVVRAPLETGDVPAAPVEAEEAAPAESAQPEAAPAPTPQPPPQSIPDIPALVPSWEPATAPRSIPLTAESEPPATEDDAVPGGERRQFDFEDIFGRLLPIWAGGIALALAGVFLVKFSIDHGMLTPQVRVALSFAFGLALLAGAEVAYRLEARVRDPRVRQALAGAGLATLYAGFYLAGTLYGLIGTGVAFAGLAAVTALAIALSFRFGLPSAVLGLVGGFAAPALVASDEGNVPVLTLYLALITAGLAFTGQRQGRPWLGYAALGGGFLWGFALLATGPGETADVLAFGLYLALMGALLPMLPGGAGVRWIRLGSAILASLQLAVLISLAGFDLLTWGLYLLLAAALAALGWREPRVREASTFAAVLGLWLLAMWDAPGPDYTVLGPPAREFALVGAGFALVFVLAPLAFLLLRRGRLLDLWQVSLTAPALMVVTYDQFGEWDMPGAEPLLAAVAAALALPPAVAAWREWREDGDTQLVVLPAASAAALAYAAPLMLVPGWAAPLVAAPVALVLGLLAWRRPQGALLNLAWAGGLITLGTLFATDLILAEAEALAGLMHPAWRDSASGTYVPLHAAVRWLAAVLPFLALARIEPRFAARTAAEALAALLAYGVVAQVLPPEWLAWTAALGAIALCLTLAERKGGWGALLGVALLWALAPFFEWTTAGTASLAGIPLLLDDVPAWREALQRLLPVAAAAAVAAWRHRSEPLLARIVLGAGGIAAFVAAHSLYKHAFALGSVDDFTRLGLAERTVWQAALAGIGLTLLWRAPPRWGRYTAIALLGVSLAHFGWFTLLVHDPLWRAQDVGSWPVLNLLLPAYAVAGLAIVVLRRLFAERIAWFCWAADATLMVLVSLLALSELRHAFSGSLLTTAPMTQTEDLLRSLTGILLAIGFLAWGSRRAERSWRIGSLVLMLLAVGKVFLVDAAGLEGLLRVASFMALGFSLIGIGWVYTRQLKAQPAGTG